ncbi:putative 1-phosphatidylinositol-3-phosphate 5-kinase FAB1D [Actinidia eriantha]|uniref:putative 1-phosphatidylinositol-3-phosphate 5-kinase FAB1D n=1 Tax=Actinidia eriantha TaxID=165200 RepID=UPI002586339C|nr:putative 1-phosphatidylinositol-3-phosphate 5-kinase FAB1D [Actinidia eriantha]XP_057490703.1 putative 1-phosphatidylinositol-3-phosphate 5-kinase FAB1D [Actinidia eriantha]XP_057490704.1 putative 1-phosphatidylinositol-3-phosphate 5-kinase FAB1D [Actinidia eriantha]XP_057490705.1 putative 1-phosphatidylinositol-3-phosphate 5-kinase FAB1D [Actinidia eriantha]XP_057490706.1 putative 1-phosphatidylinositol-3-phosphate 5-kinase FAB1D [Actinidia eriantha]
MSAVCHFCGSRSRTSLNGRYPILSCKLCGEKQDRESVKQDILGPCATQMISPIPSLTSSDSTVSNYSDISIDAYSYGRGYQDEGSSDSSREDLNYRPNEHHANGIHRSDVVAKYNFKDNIVYNRNTASRNAEIVVNGDNQEAKNNVLESGSSDMNEETDIAHSSKDENDARVWIPPEAEDKEDDMEGSVANYEDDEDECGDGTKWGKPSCLSSFVEGDSGSYRFKEEKQKAMDEVMNGKFKALVSQLLRSVGVSSSREDGDSWADMVTSLSWEAASFVKPDAIEGKAMDPDGYVKIKCIATGCRSQSQVFRGLVFKKHAAHKHMPTKYKNPRLLLIRGALGLSSSGLSSFETMQQEKDSLKSMIEMIKICHPDVILVEKSVSRDIQESILAKGITLVFDMKLHRLERVARCTGSPILSTDNLAGQKLKQCDSFNFEKFVEEHNGSGDNGKRPSKTLMFIEGCPTRLGCTILLKGTHSDALKRVKCVVQCAVVMAYHLIIETSFLLDQRAMFSTIPFSGMSSVSLTHMQSPSVQSIKSKVSGLEEPSAETGSSFTIDLPISNGFHDKGSHSSIAISNGFHEGSHNLNLALQGSSTFSYEPYNPIVLSGLSSLSASLKKVIGDSFPLSTYFRVNERDSNSRTPASLHVSTSPEAFDHYDVEVKGSSDEDKVSNHERPNSPSALCEAPSDLHESGGNNEAQMQSKDDISTMLNSESILVLMSSRNASRGTICEQSHFSHIKFYRNFDVPLGKFLQDNLLNQRLLCATCNEPPEAHFYYYAHHNKQLTVQVKRIPGDGNLPGQAVGKLWMWSCCGKCKSRNGNSKSTKRVLISTAARGLSFGKFLELSFSNHSSFSRQSSCGHSLQRDFLYFFGLGPMVAMLKHSPVATYSLSLPPQKMDFSNSIRRELLKRESENVYTKGIHLFDEVAKFMQEIASRFSGSSVNLNGASKEFSDIDEMLKQERNQFEINMQNAAAKSGNPDEVARRLVSLNRFLCDLLLESCIWDQRLHALLSSDSGVINTRTTGNEMQEQTYLNKNGTAAGETNGVLNSSERGNEVIDIGVDIEIKGEASVESKEFPVLEIPIEGSLERDASSTSSILDEDIERSNNNCQEENLPLIGDLEEDRTILITTDVGGSDHDFNASRRGSSHCSLLPNSDNLKGWIWTSFPEIRREYIKDLQRGYVPKLESICSYTVESFPNALQLITEEGSRIHIPLGSDEYIVSDYEDEFSSIISCALALLLKDLPVPTEFSNEEAMREKVSSIKMYENSHSLSRILSLTSPHWFSIGSLDSDGTRTPPSLEESHLSSFDGLNLLDTLVSFGALHPEVSMGFGKLPGKSKYSVLCLYANQFRDFRNQCCPSELDYIASLSRCRNWDAKGGKSKSFFAKTLDDRFIIKEIKKTEFESFVKFAPDYFRYMNECFQQGNQTCLAKILGIYQLTIRQTKSGREIKHDLMVMENLSFGRSIIRQYDLKGALHARFNSAADGSGDVLLDQNFVNDMNASPLYVGTKSKRMLQRAVWNDTTFLNSINVMDYSLLVGVDTQRRELVCGIIDYLRQYTWDKQLETWVKSSLVVPKNQLPTIISPREYKKRFRKFITTYFLSVPDHWCSQRSSNPCKLCGTGEDDSSPTRSQENGVPNCFSR